MMDVQNEAYRLKSERQGSYVLNQLGLCCYLLQGIIKTLSFTPRFLKLSYFV